jgi:6-phosphogluconolactonase (cycloisomerase 2 family)
VRALAIVFCAACSSSPLSATADAHADDVVPDALVSADAAPIAPARLYVANYLGGILAYDVDARGAICALDGAPFGGTARFTAFAFDPAARFAYALDDAGELLTFGVDAHGALAAAAPAVAIGGTPEGLAIDPRGAFVYAVADHAIAAFAIDPATGAPTAIDHSPFDAGATLVGLAVDPLGRFLYASSAFPSGLHAFAIDASTGAPTAIDGGPFGPSNVRTGPIAFSPDGRFAYSGGSDVSAFRIEASGALTLLDGSPLGIGGNTDIYPSSIAITPDGRRLLAANTATGTLDVLDLDATSGAPSPVSGAPFPAGPAPYAVAIDPSGRVVYVGNDDAGTVSGFALDPVSGRTTAIDGSPFAAKGLQPLLVFARWAPA